VQYCTKFAEVVDTELLRRLGVALRELRRGTAQDLRTRLYGELVDLAQADCLEVINARGKCSMSEIAADLKVDASAATRTVRRLVDAGYVNRSPDPTDARAVVVTLTDEGVALTREINRRSLEAVLDILNAFTPAEQRQLTDLLERFVKGVDAARSAAAEAV
jgi:DNA-binding MarR family transcriptional regulator